MSLLHDRVVYSCRMINLDDLFIGTMRELRQRIRSNNKYDYIKACGLLRLLLMDTKMVSEKMPKWIGGI